jgi:hypothetical protein
MQAEYENDRRDWRVGAQWNFGLGYDPLARRYRLTPTGPGSGGSVLLDAFMDENGDGLRQPGEAPVAGVVVQGGSSQRQLVTGANGGVFVSGLGVSPTSRVNVNLEKLDLAGFKAPPAVVEVNPRPGRVTRIPYPIQTTGDVMVKLELLRDDGKRVGLSSVRVRLVPETGEPIGLTTEFDGSAAFSGLTAGRYTLELDPDQARQLRMRLLQAPTIVIRTDGSFTPDVTAEVRFEDAPQSAAAAPPG